MNTIHETFSRLAFPLAALALSVAVAGAARANGIPTSTDEARALKHAVAPTHRPPAPTKPARWLAARRKPRSRSQ